MIEETAKTWGSHRLPYHPISEFYLRKFGQKPIKVPVTIASDCPNRMGLKGMKTCIFCDEWGSSAFPEQQEQDLREQLRARIETCRTEFGSKTFLAYFQAYTSTFIALKALRASFDVALEFPDMKGFVIGTRPDCLSKAVLDLWREYAEKTYVGVELGVQSFDDDQLLFLRRGHTAQASIDAIKKIKEKTGVDLGIHLIFGIPGETDEYLIRTAELVSSLPIDNVKLHHLHVLKNTPLEDLYKQGRFEPLSIEEYSRRAGLFLSHLRPDIAVHRLSALSNRWNEIVAPEWTKHKMYMYQYFLDDFRARGVTQGMCR